MTVLCHMIVLQKKQGNRKTRGEARDTFATDVVCTLKRIIHAFALCNIIVLLHTHSMPLWLYYYEWPKLKYPPTDIPQHIR
jgi:hypothetical protein